MAKNDRILLDGIVDDRVAIALPSVKRDEAFEYLAFEQVLKEFDLSSEEISQGWIDGGQDGGIDGFYILVNGHLLDDPESFHWPKTSSDLKIYLITCKHHDTFKQAVLDNLVASLSEILSLEIADEDLKGAYSESLIRMRNNLRFAYRKLSSRLAKFSIDVVYASRGDTGVIGAEVSSRAAQLETLVRDSFAACDSRCTFFGSSELVELFRKIPNYTLELPFVEALSKGERYVVLATLSDYYRFVSDGGRLRRYLFESNVRDFMGLNRVNDDIRSTLDGSGSTDFWWLNNGVTILATSARIVGKSIQATDIQIVNGLQTTESIFRHFAKAEPKVDDRCLLVKVIVSNDHAVRDSITRATNNQTDVELASLHATDKIQRDIEDVMLRHGLYYERRKNFYANQGHPASELITPLYVAAGFIALILKIPHKAVGLRSKFMRSAEAYAEVFSESVPLQVWPKIAQILKRVDAELEMLRPKGRATDKYLKNWRYITALLIVAKNLGRFDFLASDLVKFDIDVITLSEVRAVWQELDSCYPESTFPSTWTSPTKVLRASREFARRKGISGVEMLERNQDTSLGSVSSLRRAPSMTDEFLEKVRHLVPPQPWKPGMHKALCSQLGCDASAFFGAVNRLIADGLLYRQRDGVLYDIDGNVVSFDADRVDPDTLELRQAG